MELWLWVIGGLGTGAIAACLALWLLLRRLNNQAREEGVLKHENGSMRQTLDNLGKVKHVENELISKPDGDYAKRLRGKYTRPNE